MNNSMVPSLKARRPRRQLLFLTNRDRSPARHRAMGNAARRFKFRGNCRLMVAAGLSRPSRLGTQLYRLKRNRRDIGARSDAVLWTAMPGDDRSELVGRMSAAGRAYPAGCNQSLDTVAYLITFAA
jgi:hypothetical protein